MKPFRRPRQRAKSGKPHFYSGKVTVQYTSPELALKIAASGTSSVSLFQFATGILFGFRTYLLKSYDSYTAAFLPEKLYTVKRGVGGLSIKDFVCSISCFW